jgi:hypothetical protein
LRPLLLVLLFSCWAAGDTQEERFTSARAFFVLRLAPKRRRPGKTCEGFLMALTRLPACVLRATACALRVRLTELFSPHWHVDGFIPFGCDGTRLACPRTAELERYLSQDHKGPTQGQADAPASKSDTPPQVWVTALVHLRLGLLWSWVLGKPDASERQHLRKLLPTLPAGSLVVTDAGYQGYELMAALTDADVSALMRVSAQTLFYFAGAAVDLSVFSDGLVLWWPKWAREEGLGPIKVRLMRVKSSTGKSEVWMASNVLESERLRLETASRFYRMRWESEGFFRTYKRTMGKVKLLGRSVKQIHRETEGSLLAVQLLLAMGAWAVAGKGRLAQCSPAAVLKAIRAELGLRPARRGRFLDRLRRAVRDRQPRHSPKTRRPWPKRKDHKPPKPPKIRQMDDDLKSLLEHYLQLANQLQC